VTLGVFHPKVSVFSGLKASGKPTAIEPEFEFRRGRYFGISHVAHPQGIEPRIAVLEAATVTVRSGAWYSRQELNLHVDTRFERAASTDSATEHNWWAGGDSNSHALGASF
jgi:hypothetical protein